MAPFTVVGFADEVLTPPRLRKRVIVPGASAVDAYLSCLGYSPRAFFAELSEQEKSAAKEVVEICSAESIAIAATAVFVVWAKLEPKTSGGQEISEGHRWSLLLIPDLVPTIIVT